MLAQLWLPIILSAVALFFASFLSWMILGLHKADWNKAPDEDRLTKALVDCGLERGTSYMLPMCDTKERMKDPAFQKRLADGPNGIITIFQKNDMGRNLALTFIYFVITSVCLAYLGTIAFKPGAPTVDVFRFFAAAGLLTHLAAMVPQSVWFKNRIVGHAIESIAYACILGGIFAGLWPKA
jgi:hypothetical protein